ncbi:RNA polymerase recycling motor HelD [Jeotgalibaca caeni]|uniref:RNA polymerase recycling motor HelD n=1 Tax=Jeotgalibaca caeni TaxID=3028623 RepID=UPI00237E58B2|nr:RNA polymerase recycling motor HelD [Jeotgalibaca caeni]MDE1548681.1 RNA polymerase recycling motor HelD [Jeotgalibaca caeni]
MVENKDLQQEQERMDYVISVIEQEAGRLQDEYVDKLERQKELLKQSSSIRINNSSNEAMWESSGELREFEQNLTIKSNELNQVQTRRKVLEKMQEDPYFGRIDYHSVKQEDEELEQIYVGIGSLFDEGENLVVDWRAPISALYYEANVGDKISLRFGDELQKFEVDLKRQFRVKEGTITGMIDTDNVMGDPYLLEVLEGGASNQMAPVIATLQKEQNYIVRETKARNVLIQGVAGSGKTVVVMQKIAYMLYAFRAHLKAEEILLFSPNRIFQAYISQVLPSLGEWNVEGTTFAQFVKRRMPTYELIPMDISKVSPFTAVKGSLAFYHAIERYSKLLKKKYLKFRDIVLHGEVLISKEELEAMQGTIESKGSLSAQLEILRRMIISRLRELEVDAVKSKWVDEALQNMDEDDVHYFERQTHDVTKLENTMRREIVAQAFRGVERKVNNQSHLRILAQYIHFLRVVPQLMDLDEFGVSSESWDEHALLVAESLKEKKLGLDDMTAFYGLILQMRGLLKQETYQYICIDEVQDFTPFQLQLLKDLYPRARYVMAGDLNQNIWQNKLATKELGTIFEEEEMEEHLLLTSYRSTKEIMAFADQFASLSDRTAKPIRSRMKPTVWFEKSPEFRSKLEKTVQEHVARGERIAILTPNLSGIEAYSEQLNEWGIEHQVINQEDDFLSHQVIIMPIGLAKGLEFDIVIAVGTDEVLAFVQEESRQQIWYTIFSRAMHQLYVVVSDKESKLLEGIDESTYEIE